MTTPRLTQEEINKQLIMRLIIELSLLTWNPLTRGEHPDQEAAETFCCGWKVKDREVILFLSRYEDEGRKHALVSYRGEKHGSITKDPVVLEWLWDQVKTAQEAPEP